MTCFCVFAALLSAEIHPRLETVDVGKSVTLNCSTSGSPIVSVDWLHNNQPIVTNSRIRFVARDVLHIANVERRDKGMYQCILANDLDSAQAVSQIELGGKVSFLSLNCKFSPFFFQNPIVLSFSNHPLFWCMKSKLEKNNPFMLLYCFLLSYCCFYYPFPYSQTYPYIYIYISLQMMRQCFYQHLQNKLYNQVHHFL